MHTLKDDFTRATDVWATCSTHRLRIQQQAQQMPRQRDMRAAGSSDTKGRIRRVLNAISDIRQIYAPADGTIRFVECDFLLVFYTRSWWHRFLDYFRRRAELHIVYNPLVSSVEFGITG